MMPATPNSRQALVIATGWYEDARFRALRSPSRDAEELADVLGDRQIGGFDVTQITDGSQRGICAAVETFFRDRGLGDTLLLHLSCHGVKDDDGRLYFAARDTDKDLLDSTAVSADFLRRQMDRCRARTVIVLLDCCYSGAFIDGTRGDTDMHVTETFRGHGRAILTATNRAEYAWEGDHSSSLEPEPSQFTGAIVRGLRTGDADLNRDARITVDELYEYVYEQLRVSGAKQRPQKWARSEYGVLVAMVRTGAAAPARRPIPAPASAPAPTPKPPPTAPATAPTDQKDRGYDVILESIGPRKVQVIAAVRRFTKLGLKETKDLVEAAPTAVLTAVNAALATEVRAALEAVGAQASVRSNGGDSLPGYDVILESIGPRKVQVIAAVRRFTKLGLKETKDLVEAAPTAVLTAVNAALATEVRAALQQAGAHAIVR